MTRTLILLRHAKSSWSDAALDDIDRPLNRRGREAAPVIGRWLAARGHWPDHVLSSPSVRTRETCERLAEDGGAPLPDPGIVESLYHAEPEGILRVARGAPDDAKTLMIVGHQPGLGAALRRLARTPVRPRAARAFEHFPTAAAAVLTFEAARWADLAWGEGDFQDFARPRELIDA